MEEPIENAELLAFTRTVDAKSLSRAALELRVPRATIGRRLARLEERLGVRLLRRTTRSLVLTDAGEALYRHARIALEAVRQAEQSVRRSDDVVRGDLRVAVPPFTSPRFHAMIASFVLKFPEVRLQLHFSTQLVDLQGGGFDVAIRGTRALAPGLVARVITKASMIAVASPTYLAGHGPLRSARDLRTHTCLLSFARGELPQTHWTDRKGRQIQVSGSLASNDLAMLAQAAVNGAGIAFLPEPTVRSAVASGALVHVLKDTLESVSQLAVVYAEREFLPPQVRAFVDMVSTWAQEEGEPSFYPAPPQLPRTRGRRA